MRHLKVGSLLVVGGALVGARTASAQPPAAPAVRLGRPILDAPAPTQFTRGQARYESMPMPDSSPSFRHPSTMSSVSQSASSQYETMPHSGRPSRHPSTISSPPQYEKMPMHDGGRPAYRASAPDIRPKMGGTPMVTTGPQPSAPFLDPQAGSRQPTAGSPVLPHQIARRDQAILGAPEMIAPEESMVQSYPSGGFQQSPVNGGMSGEYHSPVPMYGASGQFIGNPEVCAVGDPFVSEYYETRRRFESDHAFDDFISPVTNPVFFPDARALTQLNAVFLTQQFPQDSAFRGGDYQWYAVQPQIAFTERFSFFLPKSGYVTLAADSLEHAEGIADYATGIKYVFLRDCEKRMLVSGGMIYEWAQGNQGVLQGSGHGVWNPFLTAAKGFGRMHALGAAGAHIPNDRPEETLSAYWSAHVDFEVSRGFYPLIEVNGIFYLEGGNRQSLDVEGGDFFNLGSRGVTGTHFITAAIGATRMLNPHFMFAGAFEFPVTSEQDLMDNRIVLQCTLRY